MGDLLDRRKFLQLSLTYCSGLAGLVSIPAMAWGRTTSSHNEAPAAARAPLVTPAVRVVGVGGAGCNAVNSMIASGIRGVEYIAVDTDALGLKPSLTANRILIGSESTKGTGSDPPPDIGYEIGYMAAKKDSEALRMAIQGADLLFIVAGLGGDTGTGAAPVIASIAKKLGILTIGAMTTPFLFEGKRRTRQARAGLRAIGGILDSTIVVNHQELRATVDRKVTLPDAFRISDEALCHAVTGICSLITIHGSGVGIDDVRGLLKHFNNLHARVGQGVGRGANRAKDAALAAINSPFLGVAAVKSAGGVILNVSGGLDVGVHEANEVAEIVKMTSGTDAEILLGFRVIPQLADTLVATMIAGR